MNRVLIAALIGASAVVSVSANPTVSITKVEAKTWKRVMLNSFSNVRFGVVETVAKDQMVLEVEFTAKIAWSKKGERFSLSRNDCSFVDDKGVEYPAIGIVGKDQTAQGRFPYAAQFKDALRDDRVFVYRPLFSVPAGCRGGTVTFQKQAKKIKFGAAPQSLDPGKTMKATVEGAQLVDFADSEVNIRIGKDQVSFKGRLQNPHGKLLQVDMSVEKLGEEAVPYSGHSFSILTDAKVVVPAGEAQRGGTVKHAGTKSPTMRLYFGVPATIKSFRILFHGRPISERIGEIKR